jgi:UDP:flavonoid glycosyltransferase YjiC (YdhE family)
MRILFATTRGAGHLGPLVPFAHACVAAGHQVRVAAADSVEHHVRRAGLPFAPLDAPDDTILAPVWDAVRAADPADQARIVFGEVFAGEFARSALPRMLDLARRWRPDVIVRETSEFASVAVAEEFGIATVHVACFLSGVGDLDLGLDEALQRLRPGLRLPAGEPFFTLAPRALEHPGHPAAPGVRRFHAPRPPARALPDWWDGSAAPLVYVSFGSSAAGNGFFPDIYREAAAALSELPVRVLLTLGTEVDPAELGPVAANVHVEPWVPQGAVMAHAAAMVGHGGSGSTLAAMAAGIPLAVLPLFADQPENADRVAALGAGLRLDGTGALADAVSELLEDPYYRDNARSVAAEIEALEPVDAAVELIAGSALAQAA